MITRYSSRKEPIDKTFLNKKLKNAFSYDRIAGYFSSSIFELAGEDISNITGKTRIICNSSLTKEDVETATNAKNAMRKEWCETKPEEKKINSRVLSKLFELLKNGKLEVKVVPNEVFGLIHGKAGVITYNDGSKTSFLGSINETYSAWKLNYELLWEDSSLDAVNWVQEEFDFFWMHPSAIPLADFVIDDIERLINRTSVPSVEEWRKDPEPAQVIVESPVYRKEFGLWEHQKYFVDLVFKESRKKEGARFILADMVGLGKTIQLALSAQLIGLSSDKPILIIVPKTLMKQWQQEIYDLLDMPSAILEGKKWITEDGVEYPILNNTYLKKCPRKVGIISQGLINRGSDITDVLLELNYECIIVDEAHRARRKNLKYPNNSPESNNLMKFLLDISKKTKNMLMGTATPVQLEPIEAWDLLNILSQGSIGVLGTSYSEWRKNPQRGLDLIMNKVNFETKDLFRFLSNPFPSSSEGVDFQIIRNRKQMDDDNTYLQEDYFSVDKILKKRIDNISNMENIKMFNPFIKRIVRRERKYLENTINPETNEPYLKKVEVKLMGEGENDAIILPLELKYAYLEAEKFCALLGKRVKSSGFLRTLLLRRMGSSIIAGKKTAENILNNWTSDVVLEEDDEISFNDLNDIKNITNEEIQCLQSLIHHLDLNQENDPKYKKIQEILFDWKWIERGCIIFSSFYDSAFWLASNLSKDYPNIKIGLYAGGDKSGIFVNNNFSRCNKDLLKQMVKQREIKLLIGTESASEGLNLQTLGTLINLDLPWNPTRLEQRKGRIQRIGQIYDEIFVFNMRYKDSVEDKVHEILSKRLHNIMDIFGQIPDTLEDIWINVAIGNIEDAKTQIEETSLKNPFEIKYNNMLKTIDWEKCSKVLEASDIREFFKKGW